MALKEDLLQLLLTDADVRVTVRDIMLEVLNTHEPAKVAVRAAVQAGTAQTVNLTPATVTPALIVKFQAARAIRTAQGQQAYVEYIVANLTGPEQRAFGVWFAAQP